MVVGMADSGDGHLHQDLALTGWVERDLRDLPFLADAAQDRPLTLHRAVPRGLRPTRRTPCAAAARTTPISIRNLRREYGYQSSSRDWVGIRGAVIACGRQSFSTPSAPPLRDPIPECFHPGIGRAKLKPLAITSLMLTAPASSRRATRSPRTGSPVHTVAESP